MSLPETARAVPEPAAPAPSRRMSETAAWVAGTRGGSGLQETDERPSSPTSVWDQYTDPLLQPADLEDTRSLGKFQKIVMCLSLIL